ncbi:MAG: Fic family protein [Candidatus Promineofilum sp.]|nr:Fic family protein [Promineifilum sp.]
MKPQDFGQHASGRVYRTKTGYYTFIPNSLPPALTWSDSLAQALSRADLALGELAGLGRALPNPYLLTIPFVRREAVLSSRIEGTRATLTDLYAYEAFQLSLFGEEPVSDVREVYNYVQAIEYGLQRLNKLPISLRLIRELHERLMVGTRGQERTPGEFRRSQNWIGPPGSTLTTAVYVPPPVPEMLDALADLERFMHAPSPLPVLIRLASIHYQFEAIHPFLDGNGRVGRLLIALLLAAWGVLSQPLLYLSAYFEQHRQAYYRHLLNVSQQGDWHAWLEFFLNGVHEQALDALIRIRRLQVLQEHYQQQVAEQVRVPISLVRFIDLLFEQPVFTINQMAKRLEVSYHTVRRHVAILENKGLIEEMTHSNRNRVYYARGVLAAIDSPITD